MASVFWEFLGAGVMGLSITTPVVNYFEHWGLSRTTKRVLPVHSWDTHSRFTYYALTGRAADRQWERHQIEALRGRFPNRPDAPEVCVASPNSAAADPGWSETALRKSA